MSAPPPYLYLLPGGRSRPQASDPGPLLARAWHGLDYGLRHAARQHTLAVRSAERWLVLLACSPPLPGQVAAPLRRRGLQLLGVLRDLWDSPAVGLRLLYRLSLWGLVRVVGLALVLGWVLPLLTAAR